MFYTYRQVVSIKCVVSVSMKSRLESWGKIIDECFGARVENKSSGEEETHPFNVLKCRLLSFIPICELLLSDVWVLDSMKRGFCGWGKIASNAKCCRTQNTPAGKIKAKNKQFDVRAYFGISEAEKRGVTEIINRSGICNTKNKTFCRYQTLFAIQRINCYVDTKHYL